MGGDIKCGTCRRLTEVDRGTQTVLIYEQKLRSGRTVSDTSSQHSPQKAQHSLKTGHFCEHAKDVN